MSHYGLGLLVIVLASVAGWLTLAGRPSEAGWQLVPLGLAAGAGYLLGWRVRDRRAEIEAQSGLRPPRPGEPPPRDDQPPAVAPVA